MTASSTVINFDMARHDKFYLSYKKCLIYLAIVVRCAFSVHIQFRCLFHKCYGGRHAHQQSPAVELQEKFK